MSDLNVGSPADVPAPDRGSLGGHDHHVDQEKATADLRLQKIEQLQSESVAKSDPLEANLGAASGGLLRMGYRLEQAIEGALVNLPSPFERFERLVPAIDMYLKVMRQADRFVQLGQRHRSSGQAGGPSKPR